MNATSSGQEHHQIRLVYLVLIILPAVLILIGTLNIVLFSDYGVAILDYISAAGTLAVLYYFHQTGNLAIASRIVVALFAVAIITYIHIADGRSYALIWSTLLPPVAFFLLGRKQGAWICGSVFLYLIAFVSIRLPYWQPVEIGLGTWFNIVEVLTIHWFVFLLYERSRTEAFAELEHLAVTDKLTGVLNRSRLDSILVSELQRHQRNGGSLAVVLCDIDHFKRINDEYGHLVGDEVLKNVTHFLSSQCRTTDIFGRWGGEEFLLICPATSAEEAGQLVERIRQALQQATFPIPQSVTSSFGIATLSTRTDNAEQLLRCADRALYDAKNRGRDCYVIANT